MGELKLPLQAGPEMFIHFLQPVIQGMNEVFRLMEHCIDLTGSAR